MDQRRNVTAFHMEPFGFTVTQPPPELDGYMGYQPPSTPPVALATSNCYAVPSQTLVVNSAIAQATFDNPAQTGTLALSLLYDTNAKWIKGPDGATCLALWPDGDLALQLVLGAPTSVTVNIVVARQHHVDVNPKLTIEINGTHVVTRQKVDSGEFMTVSATIDGNLTVEGINELLLHVSTESGNSYLLVKSVQVSSEAVAVQASYFWSTVAQGSIPYGNTINFSLATTSGVTTTDTETQTFAETVGVTLGASGSAEGFGTLSAQLNASFTATQSYSTAIALTETTTATTLIALTPAEGDTAISYQIWQLCIQFTAGNASIIQALDPDSYLFIREVDQDGNVII